LDISTVSEKVEILSAFSFVQWLLSISFVEEQIEVFWTGAKNIFDSKGFMIFAVDLKIRSCLIVTGV
jgi:hypothetical protein